MNFYVEYHIEDSYDHFFVNAYDFEDAQTIIDKRIIKASHDYELDHKEQSVVGFYCDARIDHIYVRIM